MPRKRASRKVKPDHILAGHESRRKRSLVGPMSPGYEWPADFGPRLRYSCAARQSACWRQFEAVSFVTKRHQWIDLHGAAGGNVAGRHRNQNPCQGRDGERERIERTDAIEKPS